MTKEELAQFKRIKQRLFSAAIQSLGDAHYKGDISATTDLYMLCCQYNTDLVFLSAMLDNALRSKSEGEK